MRNVGNFDAIEKQIRHAKKIWQRLLFNSVEASAQGFAVFVRTFFRNRCKELASRIEEAASTACEVGHGIAKLEINVRSHEVRQSTGRVVFARRTCALKPLQDGFVDRPESVRLFRIREVAFIDHLKDLVDQHAVLHVVVNVFKDQLHNTLKL